MYTLQKILIVIGGLIAVPFLWILMWGMTTGADDGSGHSLVSIGIITLISLIPIGPLYWKWNDLSNLKKFSYEWYKARHPDAMVNGRVTCFKCHNNRIAIRNLMGHTYYREHVCTQCGTTLYYSPE